jgi:hypothetical protein
LQFEETGLEAQHYRELYARSRSTLRLAPLAWRRALMSNNNAAFLESLRIAILNHVAPYSPDSVIGHRLEYVSEQLRRSDAAFDALALYSHVTRFLCHAADAFREANRLSELEKAGHLHTGARPDIDSTSYFGHAHDMLSSKDGYLNQRFVEAEQAFQDEGVGGFDDFVAAEKDDGSSERAKVDLLRALTLPSNQLRTVWTDIRLKLAEAAPLWDFWINWYEDILAGNEHDWDLLREVALIPDEVWSAGAEAVHAAVRDLFDERQPNDDTPAEAVEHALQKVDVSTEVSVETLRTAMVQNRQELPATFDAVLGFISLEIRRLQGINYFPDEEARTEVLRQIRTFSFLHEAVRRLELLVPVSSDMPQPDAVEAEKLSLLFIRKFQEWPRATAGELVDATYRFALVGAATLMLSKLGVAADHALTVVVVLLEGKSMVEAAKSAK